MEEHWEGERREKEHELELEKKIMEMRKTRNMTRRGQQRVRTTCREEEENRRRTGEEEWGGVFQTREEGEREK